MQQSVPVGYDESPMAAFMTSANSKMRVLIVSRGFTDGLPEMGKQ
jgi:hypothetical protein